MRPAPETNETETESLIAALAKLRPGAPVVDDATKGVRTLAAHCYKCHIIDGVGGKDGPIFSHAGDKLDAGMIGGASSNRSRSIRRPTSGVRRQTGKEQIRAVAVWLAGAVINRP